MYPEIFVQEAQRYLLVHPFDCIHGIDHHEAVADNCQAIILREGLSSKIDQPALMVAVHWHDVQKDSENHDFLREIMQLGGANKTFTEKVIGIISCHSFGHFQIGLEAKILYDADKLDYLSISRLKTLLDSRNKGEMTEERFDYYKQAWKSRIVSVQKTLHFKYTKKRFKEDLKELIKFMKETPQVEDMADNLMV
jgi:HD superfamily phosphodiesterase